MATKGNIVEEYRRTHPKSDELHRRAVKLFAANGATHFVRVLEPFRPYITHAKGSRKWDVDGNEYIDYTMSHGAMILGHSHPDVVRAVQEQAAKGFQYGENHALEVEWAELIKEMMPWIERVEFFACGQEADMMALRLGRIYTGRKKVLKFEEHFHGWFDHVAPPGAAGILPEDNVINTVTIPANDTDTLEKELAKREYAVLLTEGGGGHAGGQIPLDDDFVRAIPALTKKYGTLWVIDEVVTGLRDAPGGWESIVRVQPDMAVLGKCISSGVSAGALVGKADIFEPLGTEAPPEKRIKHSGTWNANPLVAAAGVAACKLLRTGEPQRKAAQAAAWLREEGNRLFKEKGISGRLYGRNIVHIHLGDIDYEPPNDTLPPTRDTKKLVNPALTAVRDRLCLHLLQRGIATLQARFFIMSMAHTKEDIDLTVKASADSLDAMVAEGMLKRA